LKDFVIRLPIGTGIAGTVAKTGETIDLSDVRKDARFYRGVDRLTGYRTHDIFCSPIWSADRKIVGVLELLNRAQPISERDKTFLNDISVHIGLALELAWVHRDVLEKRELEEKLRKLRIQLLQVDRSRLMNALLGNVMHELNNPLAILLGNIRLLKMKLETEGHSQSRRYIEHIEAAGNRSAAAVSKFLKFIQTPRRKRISLNLARVLRETLALFAHDWERNGIEIEDQLQDIPPVVANPEEMYEVFLNLLKNAKEAIGLHRKKGRIVVRSSYNQESQRVRIDVMDNGPGIPLEAHSRIFEPFFTTRPKRTGAGLGLSIAQKIVEEHEGKVWFESNKDTGTTFSVELPRAKTK